MQAENNKNDIRTLSFGCRLNSLESEKIQSMLSGLINTAIIINTCAVTAEGERQSGQAVRKVARENPNVPLFVTGCAATRNPALFTEIPNTFVIHNREKMRPEAYTDAIAGAPCDINAAKITCFNHRAQQMSKQFIQVQNGCNHRCAYCVTRLLRGPAVSFEYSTILADANAAIKNGFSEIVLTGVDIASYAANGMLISDVCRALLRDVPGIERLRLSSMDPASPEIFKIIDLMEQDPRMMRHMHLSMQSGSDTILGAMGRRHNAALVRRIAARGAQIGLTFSWDIICGFPGETDELWRETMQLVHDTRPIKVHAFPFSPRPGTPAADMPNQVPREISKQRVKDISDAAGRLRTEFMTTQVGKTVQVLVEQNNSARDPHDICVKIIGAKIPARSVCNIVVTNIKDDAFVGTAG